MIAPRALFAAAIVLSLGTPTFAQTPPRTIKDIPVFASATKVQLDTSEISMEVSLTTSMGDPVPVRSGEVAAYHVAAHPEAVYAFYRQRLGGKEDVSVEDADYTRLARGAATPVHRGEHFHNMEDEPGDLGIEAVPASKKRALFRARPAYAPNQWISEAGFNWTLRETNTDLSMFTVHISDEGLERPWSSYTPRTRLIIARTTYLDPEKAAEAADDARSSEMSIAIAKDAEAMGAGPDEATLGVAIYPGAKFDARNSAGMSRDETKYYLYLSNDEPAKVASFYQARTGKTPADLGGGEQGFVLQGRLPFPVHGVFVKPNTMFPGPAKTVITVVRKGG